LIDNKNWKKYWKLGETFGKNWGKLGENLGMRGKSRKIGENWK